MREAGAGPLVTTPLVVGENWTFLGRRAGQDRAAQFLDAIEKSTHLTVRHVDEDVEAEAWWTRRALR